MGIFGNMKVLTFPSRFLSHFRYQNGYCGCEDHQRSIMGGVQSIIAYYVLVSVSDG